MILTMPSRETSSGLLKDQAYEAIKAKILDGTYGPGTFLSERTQADELGMSKTPVRAALERLTDQCLVATSQQRGVFVRDLSASEIADLYEFRVALETYLVERLSGKLAGNVATVAEFKDNLAAQGAAVEAGDVNAYIALDVVFHMGLARADGNGTIVGAMEQQTARLQRAVTRILHNEPALLRRSVADHTIVFEDMLRGDGTAAAKHMRAHLEDSKRFLLLGELPDFVPRD